jgi:predicted lipoprotein with Yx(FWY)xxD motif
MRFLVKLTLPSIAAASLLFAACGSSSTTSTTTASNAKPASETTTASATTVKTGSTSLGTALVSPQGMTLYRLSGETGGKFICTSSACTAVWHPLTVAAGATPSGAAAIATVKRPDGTTQVTYKGAPLYTFAQDQPGEDKGQGLKDVGTWTVVTVGTGAPAASTTTTSTQSETSSSSGGGGGGAYGY